MNFLGGEWSGLENPETDISSGPSKNDLECIIPHTAAPGSMLVLAGEREMKRSRYADKLVDKLWDTYVELRQTAR